MIASILSERSDPSDRSGGKWLPVERVHGSHIQHHHLYWFKSIASWGVTGFFSDCRTKHNCINFFSLLKSIIFGGSRAVEFSFLLFHECLSREIIPCPQPPEWPKSTLDSMSLI
jgi:hypothetical protein